jgi:hypothetical protein
MTHQIKDMDVELENYHKSNSNLELAINDLKLKFKASEKEVATERARVNATMAQVRKFKVDLNECVQFIQEPKMLKVWRVPLYMGARDCACTCRAFCVARVVSPRHAAYTLTRNHPTLTQHTFLHRPTSRSCTKSTAWSAGKTRPRT